jgi:hypothetical protein
MCRYRRFDGLPRMTLRAARPRAIWILLAIAPVLLALALLAATCNGGSSPFAQTLAPNPASLRNRLSIVLRSDGQPVTGACVTVVYGMPAMDMQDAYSSRLPASANGA